MWLLSVASSFGNWNEKKGSRIAPCRNARDGIRERKRVETLINLRNFIARYQINPHFAFSVLLNDFFKNLRRKNKKLFWFIVDTLPKYYLSVSEWKHLKGVFGIAMDGIGIEIVYKSSLSWRLPSKISSEASCFFKASLFGSHEVVDSFTASILGSHRNSKKENLTVQFRIERKVWMTNFNKRNCEKLFLGEEEEMKSFQFHSIASVSRLDRFNKEFPRAGIKFIDFSSSYLSILFITFDLWDGIRRDYYNKAISSNWRIVNVFYSPPTSRDFTSYVHPASSKSFLQHQQKHFKLSMITKIYRSFFLFFGKD